MESRSRAGRAGTDDNHVTREHGPQTNTAAGLPEVLLRAHTELPGGEPRPRRDTPAGRLYLTAISSVDKQKLPHLENEEKISHKKDAAVLEFSQGWKIFSS